MGVVAPSIFLMSFPAQEPKIEHRMDEKDIAGVEKIRRFAP
jgi:hypothetical protein